MKAYRVNYRVSNKKQWEGHEPWSDVKETEVVEADNKEDAIIFLMDYLSEGARNNGYEVEMDENEQNVKIFDGEDLIEVYDFFGVKDE